MNRLCFKIDNYNSKMMTNLCDMNHGNRIDKQLNKINQYMRTYYIKMIQFELRLNTKEIK